MPFDNTNYETEIDRDLRILRAAREGISKPGGWCKGAYTKGAAHCSVGWIGIAIGSLDDLDDASDDAQRLLQPDLPTPYRWVVPYNDSHAKPSVLCLFDRAIARLERERDAK